MNSLGKCKIFGRIFVHLLLNYAYMDLKRIFLGEISCNLSSNDPLTSCPQKSAQLCTDLVQLSN